VDDANEASLLLEGGCEIDHPDDAGLTPLHNSVYHNNLKLVSLFLQRGANPNVQSKILESPLDFAIDAQHVAVVKMLLVEGKANPNLKGESSWTPLHGAASQTRNTAMEIVQLLLHAGASAAAQTDSGQYPCDVAELPAVKSVLTEAKKQAIASEELAHDPQLVHVTDSLGRTALHTAILAGDIVKSRALLVAGAQIDTQDNTGNTPLHVASYHNAAGAVQLLLEHKECGLESALKMRSNEGDSVLDYACSNGHIAIAKLLVAAGAGVNDCDERGWGCLHNACTKAHGKSVELVEFLVENNADPLLPTCDGQLPVDITTDSAVKRVLMKAMKQISEDKDFLDGGIEF
jgi:ankyrin repeat protein